MRITQRMLVDNVRMNLASTAEGLGGLQDQLSSGKRIRRPSDDPSAVSRALSLRAASDRNSQYLRNIVSARGWLEAIDSELNHLSGVLVRARDAALRGASDSIGDEGRKALGEEIDALLEEFHQGTGATHDGKYLFSGRHVTTQPFEAARTAGRITRLDYRGDQEELGRDIGGDVTLAVNVPGDVEVGGARPMTQAMETLVAIRRQLGGEGGGTPAAVTSGQLQQLSAAMDGLVTVRGTVGSKVKRLDATEESLNGAQINLATMLSRAQDADVAEVMTHLMMKENVYQAALAAGARVIQPSLLDFLR